MSTILLIKAQRTNSPFRNRPHIMQYISNLALLHAFDVVAINFIDQDSILFAGFEWIQDAEFYKRVGGMVVAMDNDHHLLP